MTATVVADFSEAEWAVWWPALTQAIGAVYPAERLVRTPEAPGSGQTPNDLRAEIDIAIVANPSPGALAGLPNLRFVQSLWAGVDRLLADATLPPDVPLARMVDPAMNAAMAETALWATLGLHRRFFHYARQQAQALWRPLRQLRADDITVAVLGLGQMGACTARRLAQQGYRVIGFSTGRTTLPDIPCAHGLAALPAVLAQADVVINLLPLTPETRGLFDAQRLSCFKPKASLVNLARGAHLVEADLLAAFDTEKIQHAVLDVFASEPLPPEHPFWCHPRVTVLPHVAAQTDPRSASLVVAQQILALREGRPLMHLVDRVRGY